MIAGAKGLWEWTADWYGADYYGASPARDPQGPEEGKQRVVRGGGWNRSARGIRTHYRGGAVVEYQVPGLGFRCIRNPS